MLVLNIVKSRENVQITPIGSIIKSQRNIFIDPLSPRKLPGEDNVGGNEALRVNLLSGGPGRPGLWEMREGGPEQCNVLQCYLVPGGLS